MKLLGAVVLFLVFVGSIGSLVMGADVLDANLPGGLPAGNAIAALALVSAAGIPLLLGTTPRLLSRLARATMLASVMWLPASIALAGNPALNFDGWRGELWLWCTLALLSVVVCHACWALVARLLFARDRNAAARPGG